MKRSSKDVAILAPEEIRRELKIIAAITGCTMKEVLARLVSAETKRIAREVKP